MTATPPPPLPQDMPWTDTTRLVCLLRFHAGLSYVHTERFDGTVKIKENAKADIPVFSILVLKMGEFIYLA